MEPAARPPAAKIPSIQIEAGQPIIVTKPSGSFLWGKARGTAALLPWDSGQVMSFGGKEGRVCLGA